MSLYPKPHRQCQNPLRNARARLDSTVVGGALNVGSVGQQTGAGEVGAVNAPVMRAIPTVYANVRFRSRLEAQWASLFDAMGIPWDYEPEGYYDGVTRYLPDFWLPKVFNRGQNIGGCWFEVKPCAPTQIERQKCEMLARGSGKRVILAGCSPAYKRTEWLHEFACEDGTEWYDNGLQFAMCDCCGNVDIGFYSGDEPACSCGIGVFSPETSDLKRVLSNFNNYARWEP